MLNVGENVTLNYLEYHRLEYSAFFPLIRLVCKPVLKQKEIHFSHIKRIYARQNFKKNWIFEGVFWGQAFFLFVYFLELDNNNVSWYQNYYIFFNNVKGLHT